jgi:hypothetical protein
MPANNGKSKHTAPPWTLKTLTGMGGPQAIAKTLPGGAEASAHERWARLRKPTIEARLRWHTRFKRSVR